MIQSLDNDAVHVLFSADNAVAYSIPKYQREYSWGQSQWENLIDDLLDHDLSDSHFLGTIICVNKTVNTTKESVLELIDGQQRLTTISLLLAAIYSVLERTPDLRDEETSADFINLKRMLVFKDPVRPRLTLQDSNSNADDYSFVLMGAGLGLEVEKPKNAGYRRLLKGFKFFVSEIEKHALDSHDFADSSNPEFDCALDVLARVKKATMVKIEVKSHADAFTLFESLNNRGMPLTSLDLIKNSLLASAENVPEVGIDKAYSQWLSWIGTLGDDSGAQDRFFRYFYNALRDEYGLAIQGVSEARRSNLIHIYDDLIQRDLKGLLSKVSVGVEAFGRLIKPVELEENPELRASFLRLIRAQGLPGHVLLLYLLVSQDRLKISDKTIVEIADLLVAFFVRRNLTAMPPTHTLVRLFMSIIVEVRSNPETDIKSVVLARLSDVSSSDEEFRNALTGPIYELNTDMVRFILTTLAEDHMTIENAQDLWSRKQTTSKPVYIWSIEHILPQTPNLTEEWIEMLGGKVAAAEAQESYVHHLGNLTISGYNSSLGARSFSAKRDHRDSGGRPIGYNNGLILNRDLAERDTWGVDQIQQRTEVLADQVMARFPIA